MQTANQMELIATLAWNSCGLAVLSIFPAKRRLVPTALPMAGTLIRFFEAGIRQVCVSATAIAAVACSRKQRGRGATLCRMRQVRMSERLIVRKILFPVDFSPF